MFGKRVSLRVLLVFLLLLIASASIWLFSGLLIFGGRVSFDYERPLEPQCNEWYEKEVFGQKLSPKEKAELSFSLLTCQQAKEHPRVERKLLTKEDLQVRLISPNMPVTPKLWLHVHGITDSYLNGMRFVSLAESLGFHLHLLELQNHGGSDRHSQGSSWGCREKFDVLAALGYLQTKYPQQEILISGTSMGTMSITQAALEDPKAFASVRALIYESPLSTIQNINERICQASGSWQRLCQFLTEDLVPFLTKLRSPQDFAQCLARTEPKLAIPTALWLSEEEFHTQKLKELAQFMPAHASVKSYWFPKGSHSAYLSANGENIKRAIQQHWQESPQKSP